VRSADTTKAAVSVAGHTEAVNCLAFNPTSEYIIATGSNDKSVALWDLRKMDSTIHVLEGHDKSVTSLAWHPSEVSILGSASNDRRVIVWDISKIGEEQSPEDQEDGVPEL
jgi:histone-binding protein RBBP4